VLALVGDQPEQMEAVGMVGIVPQDSAIDRLSRGQVAGPAAAKSWLGLVLSTRASGGRGVENKNSADNLSPAEHQSIAEQG
jgi:hypothetical protein